MSLAKGRTPRPRRLAGVVERLEARSLLSVAAVIQYRMDPQVAPDPAHGDAPDLPNTPAYVNPPAGYGLTLDASGSRGIGPGRTFAWKVAGAGGFAQYLEGEDPSTRLPQGRYRVTLAVQGLAGSKKTVTTSATIQVKDVLIVSIGDSYASGEGDPVVPGLFTVVPPQWAYSPDPAMELENALGHRSTLSGPAQFALQLQEADPHEAVTFVSVADSGASIARGLLGPLASVVDPSAQLPAQVAEVRRIIGGRHIDALTLSVGGNDAGFVSQLNSLAEDTATGSPTLATLRAQVDAALATLPGLDRQLGRAIKGLDPSQVLVTDYPDLTRNEQGAVAPIVEPGGTPLIDEAGAQFASQSIAAPLDAAVASAARANRWTDVDIAAAFATHGYPSTSTFVRQLAESLQMEGSLSGTFHPNAAGQQAIAARLLAADRGAKG